MLASMLRRGALVAALLLTSHEAQAFCRSSTCRGADCERDENNCPVLGDGIYPLYWPTSCVGYSLQQKLTEKLDPEKVRAIIQKSFDAWTNVKCPGGGTSLLSFRQFDDTPCNVSKYVKDGPNINVILFQDDDFPYRDEDNTLGKTTVTYDKNTGAILDADIEINSAFNEVTVSDKRVVYDLESIMTHELGHFIGLAHSTVDGSTMFYAYNPGETSLRDLSDDDIAAVCTVYPPDSEASCSPEPHGGLDTCPPEEDSGCAAAVRRPGASASGVMLGGLGLALLARARQSRRRRRERSLLVRS